VRSPAIVEGQIFADRGSLIRGGVVGAQVNLLLMVDQGSEFISRDLDLWAYQKGVILDFSRPGKPTESPSSGPSTAGSGQNA
jgi:transposase InsO family protein